MFIQLLILNFQLIKTTRSDWTTLQSSIDSNTISTDDSFKLANDWIHDKCDSFDLDSSAFLYSAAANFAKVHVTFNDSLDVCNYRIIQNYVVNKREQLNLNDSLFDESIDLLKCDDSFIKLEDTLDICSYRRPSLQSTEEIIVEEPDIAAFQNSINSNTSIIEYSGKMDDLGTKDNASTDKLEDSINIYNYRSSKSQLKTPTRCDYFTARYLNKCVVPFALFDTSSPVSHHQ